MSDVLPGFLDDLPEKAERTARIPMERHGAVAETAAFPCPASGLRHRPEHPRRGRPGARDPRPEQDNRACR